MKQITEEQIKAIIGTFYDLNAPVKIFEGVQKMLTELPVVEDKKEVEKK